MRVILTYRDYEALPADGKRYELHEGELSMTPAPGTQHQRFVLALAVLLREHVLAHGLGEVFISPIDCILSDITIVQPDIVFVDSGHASLISARGIEGAPTLAVEVISPSTATTDRGSKPNLYARYRVAHYWIADLELRRLDAHVLAGDAYRLAGRLAGAESGILPPFDNLRIDAAKLWSL